MSSDIVHSKTPKVAERAEKNSHMQRTKSDAAARTNAVGKMQHMAGLKTTKTISLKGFSSVEAMEAFIYGTKKRNANNAVEKAVTNCNAVQKCLPVPDNASKCQTKLADKKIMEVKRSKSAAKAKLLEMQAKTIPKTTVDNKQIKAIITTKIMPVVRSSTMSSKAKLVAESGAQQNNAALMGIHRPSKSVIPVITPTIQCSTMSSKAKLVPETEAQKNSAALMDIHTPSKSIMPVRTPTIQCSTMSSKAKLVRENEAQKKSAALMGVKRPCKSAMPVRTTTMQSSTMSNRMKVVPESGAQKKTTALLGIRRPSKSVIPVISVRRTTAGTAPSTSVAKAVGVVDAMKAHADKCAKKLHKMEDNIAAIAPSSIDVNGNKTGKKMRTTQACFSNLPFGNRKSKMVPYAMVAPNIKSTANVGTTTVTNNASSNVVTATDTAMSLSDSVSSIESVAAAANTTDTAQHTIFLDKVREVLERWFAHVKICREKLFNKQIELERDNQQVLENNKKLEVLSKSIQQIRLDRADAAENFVYCSKATYEMQKNISNLSRKYYNWLFSDTDEEAESYMNEWDKYVSEVYNVNYGFPNEEHPILQISKIYDAYADQTIPKNYYMEIVLEFLNLLDNNENEKIDKLLAEMLNKT